MSLNTPMSLRLLPLSYFALALSVLADLFDPHALGEWSSLQVIHQMADGEAQSYAPIGCCIDY